MKKGFHDNSPKMSLMVLGTLCFVTLIMCQTRFKITKEISREIYPPVQRSKDCWFLYSIGNPDRFKCVLKAFIVITSPVLSFISTCLLLVGKTESNPYFFIPWLFLTIKGLLLIQTDNIITILSDMSNRANFVFGFRLEDVKWMLLYCTIFLIDLVEAFSFYEVFDLFLVLWNHHPGYNVESATLQAVKKEIAEIMEALSKCSLGSLSKISLGSTNDSEDAENNFRKYTSRVKFSTKEDEKIYNENEPPLKLLKNESSSKTCVEEYNKIGARKSAMQLVPATASQNKLDCLTSNQLSGLNELNLTQPSKTIKKSFSKSDVVDEPVKNVDFFPLEFYKNQDFQSAVA